MIAIIDDKCEFIKLRFDSILEEQQSNIQFIRKIKNAKFRRGNNKYWDGSVKFIKFGNTIPIGLWNELKNMCEKFNFPLKFQGIERLINDSEYKLEYVTEFALKLFEKHRLDPDEDQIMAVYRALKYKKCFLDCSTSSGKTLMMYILYMLLRKKGKIRKLLIVSIDAGLIIQAHNDFIDYCGGRFDLKMGMIHGGSNLKDISDKKLIIGNFQSLSNRDPSFFSEFDCILIDEGHRGDNASNKYINESCVNAKYKIGLSGSIKDDKNAEFYDLLSYFGPIVYKISKRKWIDKGMATDIKINILILNHAPIEQRKELATIRSLGKLDYEAIFRLEQNMIRDSKIRLLWLAEFASRLVGNTLIFFLDKKYGYGKKILEAIRNTNKDKEIYYIDGDTPTDLRESYKERMEIGDNKILVASYPTFSTGKSVNNIHHIVLGESRKSFEEISQVLGRGMRKHESKDKCTTWDLVDDYSIDEVNYEYVGYMIKHMNSRIGIYKDEELVYETKKINLTNSII